VRGRRLLVVVSHPHDARWLPQGSAVPADRYLEGAAGLSRPGAVVVNLCRTRRYGSKGYYVSLLADARGQRPLPSIETGEVLAQPRNLLRRLQEAGVPTARPHRVAPATERACTAAYLGAAADPRLRSLAAAVYRLVPAPLLEVEAVRQDGAWRVSAVRALAVHRLDPAGREALCRALEDPARVARGAPSPPEERRASIAVLHDPDDPFAPSDGATLERLARVASRMNVHVHRIGLDELHRLAEYDALFVRALTGVSEPAFPFVLRAEALGIPVVDDSQSIIRCGNKVFLEELLRRERIPTPRTRIVTRHTPWEQVEELGLPLVVKLPDGSFSSAVHRVASPAEFRRLTGEMFRRSPLLIAQEYLPTDFDWRITVLDGRVLFACRYHMARGHWQIRSGSGRTERFGRVEAVPRDSAPPAVVETALAAAALIGEGLYGVDLKETPAGPVVIEVNDNPNLDTGHDDAADGRAIYEDLVDHFLRRIEQGAPADAPVAPVRARRNGPGENAAAPGERAERHYRPFEVAGMELEYPVVDADLDVVALVEPALRLLAGRPASDVELGPVSFGNEIADHVLEVRTAEPVESLAEAEAALAEGVARFSALLRDEFGARLMPTGMHPWFDPRRGRLWTRSGLRIYTTYARLFDVRTHGWMNVHAAHLNLPLGREQDAIAMHTAAALLIPYLPALAASSPVHDGRLQDAVDGRLAWILEHQAGIPESCGDLVPEYVDSFAEYRSRILAPMYRALDRHPDTRAVRREFFNARGAILRFTRRSMEIRVLDTQECVRMDVAVAAFVRAALRDLTRAVARGEIALPPHRLLVEDFRACVRHGGAAAVRAPHLVAGAGDAPDATARDALRALLERARAGARRDEEPYLDLAAGVVEAGSLSERIRAVLEPHAGDPAAFSAALRRVYGELTRSLEENRPWRGRTAAAREHMA
jgi:glutathione synthase/RimK-type ligase-like ATP-grasp enzyme/gamma-glutamyl:cysteine ligase YbdK (ATP-grasp superfamily)